MTLDIKDLRKNDESGLQKELEKTREDLRKHIVGVMQGKTKNTSKIKEFKKDIAKVMTVLNEQKEEK